MKTFLPILVYCIVAGLSVQWLLQVTLHFTRRNSSGDEIANVNFLYDDMVHVL